jgi:TM2 domain-containing membrane protein YozV
MTPTSPTLVTTPTVVVLRNPGIAAVLAWLVPGAGHLYQRRTGKGILFFVTILSTFFFGLYLGDGKVVYASWRPGDIRWAYICQVGVGLAALPALAQAYRAPDGPAIGLMAPPDLTRGGEGGELGQWNKNLHRYFELGTVYTMIAGLLNILVIYDAFAGPVDSSEVVEDDEKSTSAGAAA